MYGTIFWILFAAFSLAEGYILYKFIHNGEKQYFKATLTSYILVAAYLAADCIFAVEVSYTLLILVLISVFVQTFFGYYRKMFNRSRVFDRYHHAFAAFTFALFAHAVLVFILKPSVSPRLYSALFVAALGVALGAAFEIAEMVIDRKMHTKTQPGLKDTDFDLIFDAIGAAAAGVFTFFNIL